MFLFQLTSLAKLRVTKEARKLGNFILLNRNMLGVDHFIDENYSGRFSRKWSEVKAWGLAEEIVNHPKFQETASPKGYNLLSIKELLSERAISMVDGKVLDETVLVRGSTRGNSLAYETQFFKPDELKPPLFRWASDAPCFLKPLLETFRFFFFFMEALVASVSQSGRELSILMRGFEDECKIVIKLRELRGLRVGAKRAMRARPDKKLGLEALIRKIDRETPNIVELTQLTKKLEHRAVVLFKKGLLA